MTVSGRAWWLAVRPRTLPVAVAPVAVGTAVAAAGMGFRLLPALAALVGALCLQIASNLANDVGDFVRGADGPGRTGPLRVTQAGLLSPRDLWLGTILVLILALIPGAYLVAIGGWPIAMLGIVSMAAAVGYTAGPAYGYRGLGDLAVFLFFGVAAVMGTNYVQTGELSMLAAVASIPVGALATAILAVNNLRDVDGDAAVGKATIAVRLGRGGVRCEWLALLVVAYLVPILLWWGGQSSVWVLMPWLTVPIAIKLGSQVCTATDGPTLNQALAQNAQLAAIFSLLFAAGLMT